MILRRYTSAPVFTLATVALAACAGPEPPPPPSRPSSDTTAVADWVGSQACAECHSAESRLWSESDHRHAMEEANRETVLGDFSGATLAPGPSVSSFSHRGGSYWVRTEGADGALADHEVRYTFGIRPLQQYLVDAPGGRLQALGLAWDTRPSAAGGQRWFHLYPGEPIEPGDRLHWTGRDQNWNYMCAACHSTNLRKGYDAATDSFDTRWSEIDVACEACHGPGAVHVERARRLDGEPPEGWSSGLVSLREMPPVAWLMDSATGIARREVPRTNDTEIEVCASCHSRRAQLADAGTPGGPFLDRYLPALLDEPLYFPDGQIRDEVYVWGSFLQSRMHRAGVTCSDCHDPHSLRLRREDSALCAGCHLPTRFDTPEHHFHPEGSTGARCVACHMPTRTYMVIDARRDHSLRVPRPDLAAALGTPDACTLCHDDRTPEWAAAEIAKRYPRSTARPRHYGEVLSDGRTGVPGAAAELVALAREETIPPIVRATALALRGGLAPPPSRELLVWATHDTEPLVRLGGLRAARQVGLEERLATLPDLLGDPLAALRIEAARLLAGAPRNRLSEELAQSLDTAVAELRAALAYNADRPESRLDLGLLELALGQPQAAESAYRNALDLDPRFVPALVNLADLRRQQNRDEEGESLLRRAVALAPDDADAHHALGLLLARRKDLDGALAELRIAAERAPSDSRYGYVYAIALDSDGDTEAALRELEAVHRRHPGDVEVLSALMTISSRSGRSREALAWGRRLEQLLPNDAAVRQAVAGLEKRLASP